MKRKISERITAWKRSSSTKPLVVFGARQTGKTTSILEFGAGAYEDVVHIDFYRQPQLKAAFEGSLEPHSVLAMLEALLRRDIVPGKTLLFLDEIQGCDEAITSLKFFATDLPSLDVVAAGSLLGVHVARKGSFPVGYVDMLTMHPMDFEEFCWAAGEERAFKAVRDSAAELAPCAIHEHILDLYRSYLMVGGMPEVVSRHVEGRRLDELRETQNAIRVAYVADMVKYASASDSTKIVACWESLPGQLAKETGSTKFAWRQVASGANASRYATAVDWLAAAGVVARCTQISDGVSPLKSFENTASFKLYMADTGLLSCAYDAQLADLDGRDHRSARFRGGIAENYVMQQLVAGGLTPYYWGVASKQEVEFVVGADSSIVPIEVKSNRHVRSTSLMRFAEKYSCKQAFRVSAKNFGMQGGIVSIPLYAAVLIPEMLHRAPFEA